MIYFVETEQSEREIPFHAKNDQEALKKVENTPGVKAIFKINSGNKFEVLYERQ